MSGGLEADGRYQLVQIVDDALLKTVKLRSPLVLQFGISPERLSSPAVRGA